MTIDTWLQWGTDWIVVLQATGGPWLRQAMESFTFLGAEFFYMLVMPAVLWCFSASLGLRLGLALLISAGLNAVFKLAFSLPRPFWVDSRVRALSVETSFGLPSGHAQNAVVLWGYLAYRLRRWWATAAALILILAISFSRVFLGMHFPTDVVAGWIIGGVLLLLFIVLEEPLARWLKRRALSTRLLLAFGLSMTLLAAGGMALNAAEAKGLPAEWADRFQRALGAATPFRPASSEDLAAGAGALLGFSIGAVLLDHWGRFNGGRRGWAQAARFFVGLIGVLVLQLGLNALLPEGDPARYARYALLGLWVAYGAPRAFSALRLV
jgi:membrane-associated phospholipid phosphatase